MKVRIFVPADDDFTEYEMNSETIPPVGADFRIDDNAGLELAVERVTYLIERGSVVPQIWLRDVGPKRLDDWIASLNEDDKRL